MLILIVAIHGGHILLVQGIRRGKDGAVVLGSKEDSSLENAKAVERYKHELAKALEDHKADLSRADAKRRLESEKLLAVWRAVLEYAQIAIRTVIIANGAGALAILTYLGRVATLESQVPVRDLGISAGVFGAGVAAGFLATMFAYLSQYQVGRIAVLTGKDIVPGSRWERVVALLCVWIGLAAFLVGLGLAIRAYLSLDSG